jgi:ribonuclease BN (tRNA processing enzyme)
LSDRIPLTCLGSGAALNDGRRWNSLLLDGRILLDLPPTAVLEMIRLGLDLTAIDVIFISHVHADHMFGLPFLLLEYCIRRRRERPIYVVGPPGIEERSETLCDLAWPDMRKAGFVPHVPVEYVEVTKDGNYEAGELRFTAVQMEHFTLTAFGYRFAYRGKTFAYTGDTADCDQLGHLLDGVDVAILEWTHPHAASDPGHMDAPAITRWTDKLREKGTLVFATHMSETPEPIDGVSLCEDCKTYYV